MTETLTRNVMTMEEIEREFDGEWVIIDEPLVDAKDLVIGGTVIYHSTDRDDVDRESIALPDSVKHIAIFYIGEDDPDICYLL